MSTSDLALSGHQEVSLKNKNYFACSCCFFVLQTKQYYQKLEISQKVIHTECFIFIEFAQTKS